MREDINVDILTEKQVWEGMNKEESIRLNMESLSEKQGWGGIYL
jgi:hypothetical protein